MKRIIVLAAALGVVVHAEPRAKNIVLFLGDAGGIPTLNAASIYAHGAPRKLFLQSLPHIALSDTSAADAWVSDSAAGMTAIVTGQKTKNSVVSQSSAAVPGKVDGEALKTILEYAEERGLSTGVISNTSMADATPAACYSHVNHRRKFAEIVAQIAKARFGDGVDLVIGGGRKRIFEATVSAGMDLNKDLTEKGYALYDKPEDIPASARRVVALFDAPYDPAPVVRRAIEILSRNPKGYFLMVEWDMHTDNIKRGLDNVITMDGLIRQTASQVSEKDTLMLFTADHSFDLRIRGGRVGQPLQIAPRGDDDTRVPVRMDNTHTAEEVLVSARGPGAERVRGYMENTDLFHVMMKAYGWKVR